MFFLEKFLTPTLMQQVCMFTEIILTIFDKNKPLKLKGLLHKVALPLTDLQICNITNVYTHTRT